jgi:hypothetical protein
MVKYREQKECPYGYKKKNENPLEQSEYKVKHYSFPYRL